MKVREVMTVDPVSCQEACPISIVATGMLARDGSTVPIARSRRAIGTLTERNVAAQNKVRVELSCESRPSVLLVEDDPGTRAFLTLLLQRNGCDVDAVSDGVQALQKLKQNQYATVLLDLLMPRLNGFEVLQAVRALWPEMVGRIVVLTAASDITLADFPDEKRIFRLLRKPLDNAEVLSVVWSCAARLPVPAVRESQLAASH